MTHAEFEYELVEALNMLLEDERASVEMEVALASGATEYAEREALSFMGVEDIHFCEELRVEMEHAGLPVTPQINGIVFQVIGAERYDDRLRAFAQHQRAVAEHARELQESNLDGALREALEGIAETHERHIQWTERRAGEFATTRTLEFGSAARVGAPVPEDEPRADDPPSEDHVSMDGRMDYRSPAEQPRELAEAPTEEASAEETLAASQDEWAGEATPAEPEPEPGAFAGAAGFAAPAEVAEVAEAAEVVAEEEATPAASEPKPRARATRGAARATSAAKMAKTPRTTGKATRTPAKSAAKPAAKPKAAAKPKPATTSRRTRRAPADGGSAEA